MSAVTPPRSSLPNMPGRRFVPPRRDAPEVRRRFARRRLALAGGLLATTLAIAAGLIVILSGSGDAPPDTGAAAIVPAGALAYVNLSTDPSRPAVGRARTLAARFPDWPILAAAAQSRLDSIVGGPRPAGFTRDIRPWLGDEAALALVGAGGGSAQSLVVLQVAKPARARAFVTRAGATPAGAYRGARLLAYPSGTELAFLGRYLVAGPAAAVRSAIDAWRGPARSLARDAAYMRAASSEPPDRVLDAYLPAAGIRQLVVPRTGVAGAIGLLLDRPSLQGAAISLSATSGGARVRMDTVGRAGASRATAPSGVSFTPTLQSVLPAGSTLMVDVPGLGRAAPALLGAAATAGIGGQPRAAAGPAGLGPRRRGGQRPQHRVPVLRRDRRGDLAGADARAADRRAPAQSGGGAVRARVARGSGRARCSRPRARTPSRFPSWSTARWATRPCTSCNWVPGSRSTTR